MRLWLPASFALFALACTSATTATPDGGAGPFCPATVPTEGTACASSGTDCEYRGDGGAACTTYARCTATSGGGSGWQLTLPSPTCAVPPAGCPATFGALAQGAVCPLSGGGSCAYAEGACACAPCRTDGGTSTAAWKCLPWSIAGPGCPGSRPLSGSACSTDQLICDWGQCCSGVSLGQSQQCINGHWQSYVTGACSCAMPLCP